jgi:hypothetical protein
MKKYLNQIQKIALAVLLSLLTFGSAFAQAETAKIKDGTISNGASKAVNGAIFELESNNKGMLISRLSTAQRNAIPIANLSNGLLVYNTNTNCFDYWDALRLQWLSMCGTPPPAVFDISAVECAAITANGTYKQGVALSGDNTMTIPVTVTQPGTYTISATTANGYYFEASGSFPNANSYELTLRGTGKPNTGYATGDAGDVVSLVLNGKVSTCTPNIYVEKANVDFSVNCASIVASGSYNIGLGLTAANKLTVSINVTNLGFWNMSTNTVNGYSFSGQGTFTATGIQTVELTGTGTPLASGTNNFNISSNANTPAAASCSGIPVVVAPVAYTMNCAAATQSGSYMQNVALNAASNTITLPVNVTATGSTTISTNTINGVSFSSGPIVLTALGVQDIVLKGSGTPLTGATAALTVTGTPGVAATCSVDLVIASQPVDYTMSCSGSTSAGTYAPKVVMNAANTITIPVTVKYVGDWNITTNTVNGISFSGTGTFTTTGGGQSVILTASGTPISGGPYTYNITTNSATPGSCTKAITFTYRTMNVLGLGGGTYQPATAGTTQSSKAILASTANFGPTGKVQSDPIKIFDGGYNYGVALKNLIDTNKIDIIVIGYNYIPDIPTRATLDDFVKNKKGVLIHSQEYNDDSTAALINLICESSSVSISASGTTFTNPVLNISDPLLNGPFGDIRGTNLGSDVNNSVYAKGIPSNVTALATNKNDASKVFAFRHNTLGYVFVGDSGWTAGDTSNAALDIWPAKNSAGQPVTKAYYDGVTVYNSIMYANAIAWAIQYAQQNVKN